MGLCVAEAGLVGAKLAPPKPALPLFLGCGQSRAGHGRAGQLKVIPRVLTLGWGRAA